MRRIAGIAILPFVLLTLLTATPCPAAPESAGATPAEIVIEGIKKFTAGTFSEAEEERLAAFDKFMPKESHLAALFGEKDAAFLWERLGPGLAKMRANNEMALRDPSAKKKLTSVEVNDVRTDPVSGSRYAALLKRIPEDIPIFTAVKRYEGGSAGSGTYVVLDGKMVFIRSLDSMAEFLDERK